MWQIFFQPKYLNEIIVSVDIDLLNLWIDVGVG